MKKYFVITIAVILLIALSAGCTLGTNNTNKQPTASPADISDEEPTLAPTEEQSGDSTPVPAADPTEVPTEEPTEEPTAAPTEEPTAAPTNEPTAAPTAVPTAAPTPVPTQTPEPTPYKPACAEAVVGYYDGEKRESVIPGFTYLNLFGTRTYYVYPGEETYIPFPGNGDDWTVKLNPKSIISETKRVNNTVTIRTTAAFTGYVKFENTKTGEEAMVYSIKKAPQEADRKQTDVTKPYFLYFEKGSYTKFEKETCCLTVYKADSDGYYTVPYITLSSACGAGVDKTPVGVHSIGLSRERWHSWGGSAYGQYVIGYASGVYIHGPATSGGKVESTMMPDNYGGVGTHCSGGCLRMQTGSAYWIWHNCPDGTKLKIVSGNPLGTRTPVPAAIKSVGGKCYDPTDPILLVGKSVN